MKNKKIEKKHLKFIIFLTFVYLFIVLMSYFFIKNSIIEIDRYLIIFFLLTVISLIFIALELFIYTKNNISEEKIYLYTIPIIALLFLIIMPIFKSHDEGLHWVNVYNISQGNLIADVKSDPKALVPDNIEITWDDIKGIKYEDIFNLFNQKISNEYKEVRNKRNSSVFSNYIYSTVYRCFFYKSFYNKIYSYGLYWKIV